MTERWNFTCESLKKVESPWCSSRNSRNSVKFLRASGNAVPSTIDLVSDNGGVGQIRRREITIKLPIMAFVTFDRHEVSLQLLYNYCLASQKAVKCQTTYYSCYLNVYDRYLTTGHPLPQHHAREGMPPILVIFHLR